MNDTPKKDGYWRQQRQREVRAVIERKARTFTPRQRRDARREELRADFDGRAPDGDNKQ